jgi:hypothetical protein
VDNESVQNDSKVCETVQKNAKICKKLRERKKVRFTEGKRRIFIEVES